MIWTIGAQIIIKLTRTISIRIWLWLGLLHLDLPLFLRFLLFVTLLTSKDFITKLPAAKSEEEELLSVLTSSEIESDFLGTNLITFLTPSDFESSVLGTDLIIILVVSPGFAFEPSAVLTLLGPHASLSFVSVIFLEFLTSMETFFDPETLLTTVGWHFFWNALNSSGYNCCRLCLPIKLLGPSRTKNVKG